MERTKPFLWLALAALLVLVLAITALAAAHPDGVTVYAIQYTTTPGTGGTYPSPYDGQVVTVDSAIVTALYPNYYSGAYFVQDPGGGPWSGIMVFDGTYSPSLGDEVSLTAEVDEYYGYTELNNVSSLTVLSSGNATTVDDLSTADIPYDDPDTSEPWESVLVAVHNVLVTDDNPGFGNWLIADASAVDAMGGDEVNFGYTPLTGDRLALVRGTLWYSYDEYKIQPRDASDVIESLPLGLQKEAPATVEFGALFTYTLTIMNDTGMTLTHVVLTDALPLDVLISDLSGGGVELGGNVVSWTVPSLADGAAVSRTAAVTAPLSMTLLINDDYAVWAGNWPTRTLGAAVSTLVQSPGGIVPIHIVQGDGLVSPLAGFADLLVEGVVVGDFQNGDELSGFFLQEEDADADADPATSEGIFVFDDGFGVDVNVGDVVRVQGDVQEHYGLTELHNVGAVTVLSGGVTVTLTGVDLPVGDIDDLERYEGMWITAADLMYATETYNLGRYGEVWLSVGGRLYNPTHLAAPGAPALALQDLNDRSRLLVDDGSQVQDPPTVPYLAPDNTLRLGDVVTDLVGVLSYDNDFYRLQPTAPPNFSRENARTLAPDDAGGLLKVASFNVLNYFNGDGQGGGFPTSRGANTPEEFARQRAKIISATLAIDADVVGLMEIENDGYGPYSAIQDLVNGLNDHSAPGTYTFVNPGVAQIGTDEIAVGLLYKPGTVTPVGAPQILDSSVDPLFLDTKNRPVLAQTFEHTASGERLTVAVNHLKSKGSPCGDVGDPDLGDGQGNCNQTRTDAATALVNWLAGDPTGSGDPDALIIGDLNSYAKEDPIEAITTAGYIDLLDEFLGWSAYSYVFEGQAGYLDHALANASLAPQVAGATVWHINADEPRVLDYNEEFNPPYLYAPDAYRASDHDPVVVSLFPAAALSLTKEVMPTAVRPGDTITYTLSLRNDGFGLALDVALTDELPAAVAFAGWLEQSGAALVGHTLTWSGTLSASQGVTVAFTALVTSDHAYYGQTITNAASFSSTNGGGGSAQAAFDLESRFSIYLPLVTKND